MTLEAMLEASLPEQMRPWCAYSHAHEA